ncbi:hypothetical protein NPIL_535671 [Nephila pilipes]|uniref:Uncharacterized protein n=1 Tax=Nephila pilipes TaxID=299642 RepID=A0A8X6IQT6_NEPPI|nr:hypothetical protein NPIL_535671 [Nephila pilipes]
MTHTYTSKFYLNLRQAVEQTIQWKRTFESTRHCLLCVIIQRATRSTVDYKCLPLQLTVMESWLDVQPLRIPRPKLLSAGVESGNEIRTMSSDDIIKSNNFEVKCESVRKKIPVATK